MDESEVQPKEPRYETRIVTGDYGSQDDIGVIEILDTHESRNHHWVHFPDGQVRKWYSSRKVTNQQDLDIVEAFDLLPKLKVSYRPVTRWFSNQSEGWCIIALLLLCGLLIEGGIDLFVSFFGGPDIVNHPWVSWFSAILVYGFIATTVWAGVCLWFSNRYHTNTRYDERPREWWCDQERAKQKSNF